MGGDYAISQRSGAWVSRWTCGKYYRVPTRCRQISRKSKGPQMSAAKRSRRKMERDHQQLLHAITPTIPCALATLAARRGLLRADLPKVGSRVASREVPAAHISPSTDRSGRSRSLAGTHLPP